jgi:hypothetical protein
MQNNSRKDEPPSDGAVSNNSYVQNNLRKEITSTLTTAHEDIAKIDANTSLSLVNYVEDIYNFYKTV